MDNAFIADKSEQVGISIGGDIYKTLVETMPQKIFVKDRNYRWILVNQLFADDLNMKPEEVVGKIDHDLFPKELADKYHADDIRLMESGETEEIVEKYIVEGEDKVVNTIKTPIKDKEGNIVGLLGIFWDITEKFKLQDELNRHRLHLEEMVKNRTSELTEINNLLKKEISEGKRRERIIEQQSQEILELSTPVIKIWNGIVVAPLIGSLDSMRTQQFIDRLLNTIVETNSEVALLDITGVPTIDTQTAQHLIEAITASKLLGAKVILTGVRPAIAQTLVHLGIDLTGISTNSSLAGGLKIALNLLELQVVDKIKKNCKGEDNR